jgi:hypothetical protein
MVPSGADPASRQYVKIEPVTTSVDPDGSTLLTSTEVKDLLSAAVEHAGGTLVSWRLDHVDANPGHSTTATYSAAVDWPSGRRTELLGASARAGGRSFSDERAMIFGDGDREVAVWLYPDDPDLPGLRRAAVPDGLAGLLNEHRVLDPPVTDAHVALEMISYRPRRRAVLKAVITTSSGPRTFFVKVLRESVYAPTLQRHELLRRARFPAAVVAAATADFILVFHEVPGRPLVKAIFDEAMPCTAESMIMLLDALPPAVASLPRRPPWTGAVATYAEMIAAALPALDPQLRWLVAQVSGGLAGLSPGVEPTHGDFHEGQLFVSKGVITGVLDIDTIGPGRRADDLACMIAHLSTMQRMTAEQAASLTRLINLWLQVFDTRVDPAELRLRAAGVIVSLATGPYRGQEPNWESETVRMIESAVSLVQSAALV